MKNGKKWAANNEKMKSGTTKGSLPARQKITRNPPL